MRSCRGSGDGVLTATAYVTQCQADNVGQVGQARTGTTGMTRGTTRSLCAC